MAKYTTYDNLKKELLRDPEVKKAYDSLEAEYQIAASVIRKRLERKMTQKELAKKVGTKQSAISRLESGEYNSSITFLAKVAKALGTKLQVDLI